MPSPHVWSYLYTVLIWLACSAVCHILCKIQAVDPPQPGFTDAGASYRSYIVDLTMGVSQAYGHAVSECHQCPEQDVSRGGPRHRNSCKCSRVNRCFGFRPGLRFCDRNQPRSSRNFPRMRLNSNRTHFRSLVPGTGIPPLCKSIKKTSGRPGSRGPAFWKQSSSHARHQCRSSLACCAQSSRRTAWGCPGPACTPACRW